MNTYGLKMVRFCSVDNCFSKTDDGISFFRCPKAPQRCEQWKKILGFIGSHRFSSLTSEQCHAKIKICGLHFENKYFANAKKTHLKSDAVPTLRLERDLRVFHTSTQTSITQVSSAVLNEINPGVESAERVADIKIEDMKDTFDDIVLKSLNESLGPMEFNNCDLEIHQICRGCLSTTDVSNMQNTLINGCSSIILYEELTNVKVEGDNLPTMMCSKCLNQLGKLYIFVKMLRHSYTILSNAAKEIETLSKHRQANWEQYVVEKAALLREVLKEKFEEPDETVLSKSEQHLSVNDWSDNYSSAPQDSESSDDEIPLSERFGIDVRMADNRKANSDSESIPTHNICPLCSKKVRNSIEHLRSLHSLDWNKSKCLKCSYYNSEKDKLVEHAKACTAMKVESIEKMGGDADDWEDPDFETDEPERVNIDEASESHFKKTRCRSNKNFSCCLCESNVVVFSSYDEAELHLKSVHSGASKCILCAQDFTNCFALLYHMMVKHGKLKCCRLCLVSFKNSDELNAHYKSQEHNTKCTVCGEQFRNRKAVYEHRRKKHLNPQPENQKYKCPECPKEFANQNNIRRHVLVAHNDLRFLCDTCGQSYTTKRNLKLHIQKFHEGLQVQNKTQKKNFFCEACGKELKIFNKYAIALHRAKHRGHGFVCKKCYDSFATEKAFKRHVDDSGHHLYECDKCRSQFVREENFKIHLKNHDAPGWNKNMFATWGKSAKLRNEKGEFVCSYCPKVFKDKQRLDNHVRVHTNERPYKCHICSKGFKTWIHRKTHLNIHLGIKKWVCKYCSKAFTNSCTLKGHEMLHTGERPHRCPECKKGFITMSAMKKHRMIHFRAGSDNYGGKKDRPRPKEEIEDKSDSEHEENADLFYKYGQMFGGGGGGSSDVSYGSFADPPPKESGSIDQELSC